MHPIVSCRKPYSEQAHQQPRSPSRRSVSRMSKYESLESAQAKRPDFVADKFELSKSPNPEWRPGQGLNGRRDLPAYDLFEQGATVQGSQQLFRHIDPTKVQDKRSLYKLMIGGITPRPIAFCSTISSTGVHNLAPFSYFSPMGFRPPKLMVHFSCSVPFVDGEGRHKDTLNNIKATKQFVVNMISEPFIEAANFTSIDSPDDISEWDLSGLTPVSSDLVRPPRVGESAFSMECELDFFHDIYAEPEKKTLTGTFVVGNIVKFHAREDLFNANDAIEPSRLLAVSRMGGITYGRVTDAFEAPRHSWTAYEEACKGVDPAQNLQDTKNMHKSNGV